MKSSDQASRGKSHMSDESLSSLYRKANEQVEPSSETDQAILTAARIKAETYRQGKSRALFFGGSAFRGWSSVAAASAVCVSLWVVLQAPPTQELLTPEDLSTANSPVAEVMSDIVVESSSLEEVIVTAAKSGAESEPSFDDVGASTLAGEIDSGVLAKSSPPTAVPQAEESRLQERSYSEVTGQVREAEMQRLRMAEQRAINADSANSERKLAMKKQLAKQKSMAFANVEPSTDDSELCALKTSSKGVGEIPSVDDYVDYLEEAIEKSDGNEVRRCLKHFEQDYPDVELPEQLTQSLERFQSEP